MFKIVKVAQLRRIYTLIIRPKTKQNFSFQVCIVLRQV